MSDTQQLFALPEADPPFPLTARYAWATAPAPLFKKYMTMSGERVLSPAWLEWHAARGLDPHASRRNPLPVDLRRAVIERDGYVCRLCGGDVEPDDIHIDHAIPVSKGGRDVLDNLQVAHSFCNLSKGARV